MKAGRFPRLRKPSRRAMVCAMVCAVLLLTYGPSKLIGQFGGLATTDDGSTLYFDSVVRPKGSSLSLHSKIYRWTARDGVLVFAEEPSERFDGCAQQFFYQLYKPQVSADGGTVAYTGTRPSATGKFCPPSEPNEAVILLANHSIKLPGTVALSRNGRYAVTVPMDAQANDLHLVTDLATGQTSLVEGAFNGSASRVTDAGAVITPKSTAILITERDGGTQVYQTQQAVDGAVIDRMGRTIVYTTQLGPFNPGRIAAIDVLSGRETQLGTGFGFDVVGIVQDGSAVYYRDASQQGVLSAIDTNGMNPRQFVKIQGPLESATLSGDGRVVFATSGSSLLRIDASSGTVTEIVPATPVIMAAFRGGLPPQTDIAPVGSVMVFWGGGLRDVTDASFCGFPVTLLEATAIGMPSVRFQVPWDLAEGSCVAVVRADSPFESGISLEVREYDPQFLYNANPPILWHENFSGTIAASSPARVGEVISFYMTGLGPVDAAGMVSAGFGCNVGSSTAEILYGGLAPGAAGLYQVNLRIPAIASSSGSFTSAPLVCGFNADLQAVAPLWVK